MDHVELHGNTYVFGFSAADAPAITGFSCRKAELKYAPEVKVEATNGEGHVESIALSKSAKRMITGTFTGYITDSFVPSTLANYFEFKDRYFIVDDISQPSNKGEFVEVSITATSKALVTGIAV